MQKAIFSLLFILMKLGTLFHGIYISDTIDWKRCSFNRKFGTDVILEKFKFNARLCIITLVFHQKNQVSNVEPEARDRR